MSTYQQAYQAARRKAQIRLRDKHAEEWHALMTEEMERLGWTYQSMEQRQVNSIVKKAQALGLVVTTPSTNTEHDTVQGEPA